MKKAVLIFSLIFITSFCFAQETKSITKDSLKYLETYEVLKAKPKIRQGADTLTIARTGRLLTTGFYKNNKRDSLWREYNSRNRVIAEGYYKDGHKLGEWKYYDNQLNLINKYDFTLNALTYHQLTKLDSTHRYFVKVKTDTLTTLLDRAPIYLGGDEVMTRPLIHNVIAPLPALQKGLVGVVIISFMVDENGHATAPRVEKPIGYGCDEEALRLVKLIPDNWVPGKLNGNNVAVLMRIPMSFNFTVKQTIALPPTIIYH